MEADPEAYNCDACPVADALSSLGDDPENAEAWQLFQRTVSRFTVDAHIAGAVLLKLAGERTPEDFGELVERFSVLYDVLCPVPERKET